MILYFFLLIEHDLWTLLFQSERYVMTQFLIIKIVTLHFGDSSSFYL